ncbi:1-phosphatidylinositol 4,5-bisphosphate phosphodiesterase delta-4-like [Notothenia coriiceps]|uniref:1-phosphatidylinositol 4,5-bisphosphate phosphodiesterase delta-4-like n=1 Tax=Notothenia coriiceps TaxID=8208 RepID=A0A6I9P1S4_9TELE|nr:PREDICTED: 1-phosphatidylinositol 4,5-bisphosphate phosphodiesterase delta-4-like [Notothenia coriiceps]
MTNHEAESLSAEEPPAGTLNRDGKKSKAKLSKELSDLVVYCKSVHFHGFEYARSYGKCSEMSSFSESKAKRLAKDTGTDFVQYHTRQLSRIYPAGRRTDSSNYNPQDMWSVGCQIGEGEPSHFEYFQQGPLQNKHQEGVPCPASPTPTDLKEGCPISGRSVSRNPPVLLTYTRV